MIDFEEELKKFHPSLEVEDAEEAIYNQDLTDMADVLVKMVKEAKKEEESPKKKRSKSYSRTKGHSYETKIAKELRELGYEGIVTSRSESKSTDDKKVDLIDTQNQFPYYVQLKCTQNTPAYHQISAECPLKDKPFILI